MDTRRDAGQFYPGGNVVATRPVATGGDMKRSEFAELEGVPERFTDTTVRDKLNEVIGLLKGSTAALALTLALDALGAGITVQTAPKGTIYNDEHIVTNVTWSAEGLATEEGLAELSSAIRTNYYTRGEVDAAVENAQPGDYANVSNKATTAIQLANIAPNFATPREYKPGDLVIKDGELCVCIQAGAGEYAVFMSAQVCDGIAQLRESLAAVALSGAYSDISGAPTNVSAFTNDAGYLTSFTETDPTISSWAKAANKPSYTASEVGALGTSGEQTIAGTGSQEITFSFGSAVPRFTLVDSYGNTTHVEADDSSVLRSPIWLKLPATDGTVALTSDIPASMAWGAITGKPTTISGYGITDALKSDFTSLTNNAAFTSAVAAVSPPTDTSELEARGFVRIVADDEIYFVTITTTQTEE